jgi:hypothetical protein
MTITTTSLGNNTTQITLSGETSVTNFINSLDSIITANGWSQYDVTNPYNRIYSSLNADGSTYKLIGITIDPGTLKISTTTYELWNTTTHVGTNEAYTFNRAGTMGIAFNLCDVLVMVSPHWLVLQTFIRNEPSPWAGVFEVAREAPEDTASNGYPCWCWASSATIFSTFGTTRPFVSFPRTVGGLTGLNAVINTSNLGLQLPYVKLGGNLGQATTSLTSFVQYAWNSNNRIIQSARPVFGLSELHGQIYGLKFTYNLGSPWNTVPVPINTSTFNYSATGTSTPHWILGANPTTAYTNVVLNNGTNGGSGYSVLNSVSVGGIFAACPVGSNWYVSTSSGVYIIDNSGTTLNVLNQVPGISGVCFDIEFDNSRYVYVSTASGVAQIDTQNNNAVANLTIAGGTSSLFWDGTYLWAGARGSVTSNNVFQITGSTFTLTATIPLTNTVAAYIGGICSDNAGNTYVVTTETILYKIVNSSSVVSKLTATIGTAGYTSGVYFNGNQLMVCYQAGSNAAFNYYTTSGSLLNSNTIACNPTAASIQGYGKAEVGKIGAYDYYSVYYNASGSGTMLNLNGYGGAAFTTTAQTSFICDGNRAFASSQSNFYLYTGLFHPDEASTVNGRMLLPK